MGKQEIVECELVDGKSLTIFLDEEATAKELVIEVMAELKNPVSTDEWKVRQKPSVNLINGTVDEEDLRTLDHGASHTPFP